MRSCRRVLILVLVALLKPACGDSLVVSPPGLFSLVAPGNGDTGLSPTPVFSWTTSTGAASYTLQVSTNSSFSSFVTNISGIVGTSHAQPTTLLLNKTYFWRVRADSPGAGTWATGIPWSFTTIASLPGPFSLSSPADAATSVSRSPTYSWTSSTLAASYTLQVSTSSIFSSYVVNRSGIVGTSFTPYATLAAGLPHYWRVSAENVAGSTPASNAPRSFTTLDAPGISLTSSTLSFTAPSAGPAPASQIVTLSNPKGAASPLNWVAVSNQPWLQVSPLSGALGAGTQDLTVSVTPVQTEAWTTATSLTGSASAREDFSMIWTGKEMIVWGGTTDFGGVQTNTGAKYDPVTDTWTGALSTLGAPSARRGHRGVWTGQEMIVCGGYNGTTFLNDGYRYNPRTDLWSPPISTVGAPSGRFSASACWTGSRLLIWGGQNNGTYLNDGASYDPATDTWSPISSVGAPTARWHAAAAWTGTEMLVFGGQDASATLHNDGGRYNPSTDTWGTAPSTTGAPPPCDGASAVFDGIEMIVWGGFPGTSGTTNVGGRYNPITDSWTATTLTGAPTPARSHEAVWAGSEMIVWGGSNGGFLASGKVYLPPLGLAAGVYGGTITVIDPAASNSPQTITVTFTVTP